MTSKRWSIPSWLTRWFALTVGVAVLALSGMSLWFVRQASERELDALVLEELHEMRAGFGSSNSIAEFEDLVDGFASEHRLNPLAWRVWHEESRELWGEFGPPELLNSAPADYGELHLTTPLTSDLRWRAAPFPSGLVVGLVVDGAWQMELLERLTLAVLGIGGIAALLAVASGAFLGRRLARHLDEVAAQVRAIQIPSANQEFTVTGAPEEIREVAGALCEMFRNIRSEQDRVRLMTAGLAHELRSPIQNLMSEVEVALMRSREKEEYREVLRNQFEELGDLGRVVDNLVMLCAPREEGGPTLERFDLKPEANLRLKPNRRAADHAGVMIDLRTEGELTVEGDREALLLALNNLVGNAVKWSPRDSTVRVQLCGNTDSIEISVEDSGPGVPEGEREKIFEPFYRGPQADQLDGGGGNEGSVARRIGYGLGLALVRNVVLAHQGEIEVSDSQYGGARFVLRIPR